MTVVYCPPFKVLFVAVAVVVAYRFFFAPNKARIEQNNTNNN